MEFPVLGNGRRRSRCNSESRMGFRIRGVFRQRGKCRIQSVGVCRTPERNPPRGIRSARACLDAVFGADYLASIPLLCSTEVLKLEPIWRMLFTPQIVKALKAALGFDLCYQNDLDVQRNSFGLIRWRRHTGWHMDAGSEAGNSYLTSTNYRFAKCGIFLQDFDNGWGGGIRVKAKSHRAMSEGNAFKRKMYLLRRRANAAAHTPAPGLRHLEGAHSSRRFLLFRL